MRLPEVALQGTGTCRPQRTAHLVVAPGEESSWQLLDQARLRIRKGWEREFHGCSQSRANVSRQSGVLFRDNIIGIVFQ
jgi:hypothetical protein